VRVGFIGSGNIARSLAEGLKADFLCTDNGSGRAEKLATEFGGTAVQTNQELIKKADVVFLCHKPKQLKAVAKEFSNELQVPVVSVLAGVKLEELEDAFPQVPVVRAMVNTPISLGKGVVCYLPAKSCSQQLEDSLVELFNRLGLVERLSNDESIDIATAVMGVGPAYVALLVEAWTDSAVKRGLTAGQAAQIVCSTFDGSVALVAESNFDTLGVRRRVTSPGGVTAKGVAALERAGVRDAFIEAMEAVLGK